MYLRSCLLALVFASFADGGSDFKTCGKVTADLNSGTFIVGGKKADDGEWPWQAALFRGGRRICGASLIHPEWILTAAHCIDVVTEPSLFQFLMGTNSLVLENYENSNRTQFINVTEVYVHPNYRPYRSDHDIALLKLKSPFQITDYVRTVCIPSNATEFMDGEMCTVTGWGTTEFGGKQNPDLFEVEVPIVNQEECNRNYTSQITDDMICAGATGLDSCQGDSGGPMVIKKNGNWMQVGVVSWGTGCGFESYPGVYARVTYFSDWIEPIFNGGVPEKLPGDKCSEAEYLCEGGYCIEYESKCDGSNTCYFKTDEKYCETYVRYFDYKKGKKILNPEIVTGTNSLDDCAQKCLEFEKFNCTQFDYTEAGSKCKLGHSQSILDDEEDDPLMHFELQYFKHDNIVFTGKSGAIAAPAWTSSNSTGPWYHWTFEIESNSVNRIQFDFNVLFPMSSQCSSMDSMVVVRAGNESNSKPVEASCAQMMDKNVIVEGKQARIDFYTEDRQANGFMATYTGYWECDNEFVEEGKVTSPNYPENYPNGATCRTLIQAPKGRTIELRMDDFNLEKDGDILGLCESDWDTLSIYDGPNDESEIYGEYCGDMINKTFVSTNNSMYLVFKSDSNTNDKGFKATFKFLTDEIPEYQKEINELNDALNGYKFGLAGLFVFCLLSILVLSASLYTVTKRETETYNEYMEEKLKAPTRLVETTNSNGNRNLSSETQTPEGQVNYGLEASKH